MHVTGNVLTAIFVIIVGLGGLGALRFNALKAANEAIKSINFRMEEVERENGQLKAKCADLEQRCQMLTELVTNAAAVGSLAEAVEKGHALILARIDRIALLVESDSPDKPKA